MSQPETVQASGDTGVALPSAPPGTATAWTPRWFEIGWVEGLVYALVPALAWLCSIQAFEVSESARGAVTAASASHVASLVLLAALGWFVWQHVGTDVWKPGVPALLLAIPLLILCIGEGYPPMLDQEGYAVPGTGGDGVVIVLAIFGLVSAVAGAILLIVWTVRRRRGDGGGLGAFMGLFPIAWLGILNLWGLFTVKSRVDAWQYYHEHHVPVPGVIWLCMLLLVMAGIQRRRLE